MARISPDEAGGPNVCALLDAIAWSEIGSEMLERSDDGYNVLVGSRPEHMLTFPSYASHPKTRDEALNSDAAGRYQILSHWWVRYQPTLHLPDFSPLSQDRYAIEQFKEQGAFGLIRVGRLGPAIERIANIWASLPAAGYDQHENSYSAIEAAYCAAGGTLADCEVKP